MPVFGPITSKRSPRNFGVFDLEWVPGEALPPVVNTEVEVEGVRDLFRVPLPVGEPDDRPAPAAPRRLLRPAAEACEGEETTGTSPRWWSGTSRSPRSGARANFLLSARTGDAGSLPTPGGWPTCSSCSTTSWPRSRTRLRVVGDAAQHDRLRARRQEGRRTRGG